MEPATRRAIGVGVRLAAAHHPLCGWFRHDVVLLGGVRVCSGCLAMWPAFALAFPAAVWLAQGGTAPAWALVGAGTALGLPQGATLVRRMGRAARAAAKLVGGVGLALVVVGGVAAPIPWAAKAACAAALAAALGAALAWRMRSILRTCDRCPWRRDWDACPGFNPWEDARG